MLQTSQAKGGGQHENYLYNATMIERMASTSASAEVEQQDLG
jgi:hypothetical protein